jgi:hypothetical protein
METSRFNTFTQEQYDAIYAQLVSGEVEVNNAHGISISELGLELVEVTETN